MDEYLFHKTHLKPSLIPIRRLQFFFLDIEFQFLFFLFLPLMEFAILFVIPLNLQGPPWALQRHLQGPHQ
jgi:hypothetical protein